MNERSMTSEQEKAAHRASLARSENKIFFKRKVLPFAVIVSALCTLLFWWRSLPDRTVHPIFEEKSRVVEEQRTSIPRQPQTTQDEVKWNQVSTDGTLPVDVWSPWIKIGVGCKLDFSLNEEMKAEWLDYNDKIHSLTVGEHIGSATAIRFMPTVAGKKKYPYKMTCS